MNTTYSSLSKGKTEKIEHFGGSFITAAELIPSPVKFSYLEKRPKSSVPARPSSKISQVKNSTGAGMGPGKYSAVKSSNNPSFEFSRCERFDCDIFAKFRVFRTLSVDEKHKINKRVRRNKEEAVISKEERLEMSKKYVEKQKIRATVAKITRDNLSSLKKREKIEKRKDKMRKFEYRMRLEEIGEIKKTWLLFGVYVCFTTVLKYGIVYRKDLRKRSSRHLRVFQFKVKFIGKMHRIHIRLKYYKGMRIIKIYLIKYVKLWQKQRYKRNKNFINTYLEKIIVCTCIRSMCQKWVQAFRLIKTCMRKAMFYKVSLYQSLIHRWNKCEYEFQGETAPVFQRVRRSISIHSSKNAESHGCLNIPFEVKLHYIRDFIREKIIQYLKAYKIYKTHFKSVHRQNLKNRLLLGNDTIIEYPIPPQWVSIFEEFTLENMKEVIQKALNEKSLWKNIMFSDLGRIGKVYQQRMQNSILTTVN